MDIVIEKIISPFELKEIFFEFFCFLIPKVPTHKRSSKNSIY